MLTNRKIKLNIFILLMALTLLVSSEADGQSVDESLVSWWPMESPVVEDIIGDNEPSATGGLTFVDGKVVEGVTFDSPATTPCGGYIDIPHSTSLANQTFTLEAWARPEGPGPTTDGWGNVVITKTVSGNYQSVYLSWSAEGAPVEPLPRDGQWTRKPNRFVVIYGSHWDGEYIESEIECPPGEFYHVAVTYDGTTFKLFVNGILTAEKVDGRSITYTSSPWVIGSTIRRCWHPRTWNGVIDEVRIYNRALTAEEIQARAGVDSDNDGLSDDDELIYGTDPNNPDTDADGLLDGTEVDMAEGSGCPDPVNPDSDGDTLLDGDEVNAGTNPCNVDTDGDELTDDIDPYPLDPEVTNDVLEQVARTLCAMIRDLDVGLFSGPNNNANKGRRNALANRAASAANAIADGDIDSAIASLESLLDKIDSAAPPPDWLYESPEKTNVAALASQLIALLSG